MFLASSFVNGGVAFEYKEVVDIEIILFLINLIKLPK